MRRERVAPRADWVERVEALGFDYHTIDGEPYWVEDAFYVFDEDEIDLIESATAELHALSLDAVDRIVRAGRCDELGLDARAIALVERSWAAREPALYGRMDLSYDGRGFPRLLEYNADTPTALFEAAVVQWHWLEERYPECDQFNSIHEKLIAQWPKVAREKYVHFAACYEQPEDRATCEYLRDTCVQAGFDTTGLDIEEVGWSGNGFIDLENRVIRSLFKLYPWEWMLAEEYAQHLPQVQMQWIEPAWKMLLSNKAILPLLWEFFPNHPNLLPASRKREDVPGAVVRKPTLGREGEGIIVLEEFAAEPPAEGDCIYQAFAPLPVFDARHVLVGSWVIGNDAAGIGLREDASAITCNTSCFVPHRF